MGSLATWLARNAGWFAGMGGIWLLLPDAGPGDPVFEIPLYVMTPLSGVLQLDRYFPIGVMLGLVVFDVTLRVGMFAVWLANWVWAKVAP